MFSQMYISPLFVYDERIVGISLSIIYYIEQFLSFCYITVQLQATF